MNQYDVCIIGGGAAGLACAIELKRTAPNYRVAILEKHPRIGKKILATGNGRCNLGHTPIHQSDYHGSIDPMPIFGKTGDTVAFFRTLGLHTRTDEMGRIYPYSNQATAVLDALRHAVDALKIEVFCDHEVDQIRHQHGQFILTTNPSQDRFSCRQLVLATAGKASPALGTDGAGFTLARAFGHQITSLTPALCAIPTLPMKPLKGVRLQAGCTAYKNGNPIKQELGEVQFTEQALSGICIFNLARYQPDQIVLDLLPQCRVDEVKTMLYALRDARKHTLPCDWFTGLFAKPIAQYLLKAVGIAPDKPLDPKHASNAIDTLAQLVKAWNFPVTGCADFQKAQVTAGGIDATQVTDRLESKLQKGLYFAGEMLDVDGDCGGYNLHFAWSSGRFVAHSITHP